jgi:hypothetical protein
MFSLHRFLKFSFLSNLGDAGTIFATSDGGLTWASVSAGLPVAAQGNNIRFHSISVGAIDYAPTNLLDDGLVMSRPPEALNHFFHSSFVGY